MSDKATRPEHDHLYKMLTNALLNRNFHDEEAIKDIVFQFVLTLPGDDITLEGLTSHNNYIGTMVSGVTYFIRVEELESEFEQFGDEDWKELASKSTARLSSNKQ